MNNQGMMVSKKDADKLIIVQKYEEISEDTLIQKQDNKMIAVKDYSKIINVDSQTGMMARDQILPEKQIENINDINNINDLNDVQDKNLYDPDINKSTKDVRSIINRQQEAVKQQLANNSTQNISDNTKTVQNTSSQTVSADQKQPVSQNTAQNNTSQTNANKKSVKLQMRTVLSIDDLVNTYIKIFEEHFDIKLSSSICFENMRKLCDIDVKTPDMSLYVLENTYRLSTLMYLTEHLPIIIVASILAEKNRKNILNYVTTEVENASKKIEDVIALRKKRWYEKYKNMNINDAMTVTPGVTNISSELIKLMCDNFNTMCNNLKKFNKELSDIISKFDDNTKNDVIFIYSNWWYLLQGFENEPNMRSYIMSITDDTRKNLKI